MPMIAFKDPHLVHEWTEMDPRLLRIGLILLNRWPDEYMEITRIFDPRSVEEARAAGESGVHCSRPHRAFDARTKDLPEHIVESVIRVLRVQFQYDHLQPKLNVVFQHDAGSGRHLHVQVHPNTVENWA